MVSTRSSTGLTPRPPKSRDAAAGSDLVIPLPTRSRRSATPSAAPAARAPPAGWAHRPSPLALLWLAVSLPLVAWDTGYVLGRPATMPGGWAHWPLWVPYELYGQVDHVYGFEAWNAGLGFTGAQGMMNLIETGLYLWYWGVWYRNKGVDGRVAGRRGGLAVVLGLSASVMTLSKTMLYCEYTWGRMRREARKDRESQKLTETGLNEYYSGFDSIGHNSLSSLIVLWIIPK